jgi:cytochrome c peroxidase
VLAPEPPDLLNYVADKAAAIALGKALFWDMQLGSDGVQACASCHFNAGADVRSKNQLSPALLSGDVEFGNSTIPGKSGRLHFGPNLELTIDDFPLHQRFPATERVPRPDLLNPTPVDNEFDSVLFDTNDIVSSQGVRLTDFIGLNPRHPFHQDVGNRLHDPVFKVVTRRPAESPRETIRRVEPRNAPQTINAVFNFDNFWDGRASAIFNGLNPFGFRDQNSTLRKGDRINPAAPLTEEKVRLIHSSLASQAVGPPLSDFEMSFKNRSFPLLGRKMLALRPLARQLVHPEDSVLGPLSQARALRNGRVAGRRGLRVSTYAQMIQDAFQPEWWNSTQLVNAPDGPFTQMEWNFSFYFGLSVQLYEATLIADDTPFDRFMGSPLNVRGGGVPIPPDPTALTPQEQLGLDLFQGTNLSGLNPGLVDGRCINCHQLPETTNHSVRNVQVNANGVPELIIESMVMGDGQIALYDNGMYNIAVRRSSEDIGRASRSPFLNPLTGENFPLSYVELGLLKRQNLLPDDVAAFVPDPPGGGDRVAVTGSFKASSIRNAEFTGPYFHQGGDATLRHVVEFYVRGGNFPATNFADLDVDMDGIPGMDTSVADPVEAAAAEERIQALVAFLARGLTDERVQFERAPFDHPELQVPAGVRGVNAGKDIMVRIPAVGRNGRATGIPRFLGLDPQAP